MSMPLKAIEALLEPGEAYTEVRGWPGYLVTTLGRVVSVKQRRATIMRTWSKATSESVVELTKDGYSAQVSTEKLRREHFDAYLTPLSEVETYLKDFYADNAEVQAWVEETLGPQIKRAG